ncbi:GIY-YIG nuclease family protein [Zhongshania borealis]|uniref:GIY-YIG nuclease family protein n=1 Tax=Zhongshania borealis TaxID=889488 RepID=A0ABP7WL43_9GAMM
MKSPAIYILSNRPNGVLYIGVTSNLPNRIWQHRRGYLDGFSKQYRTHLLVYYEQFDDMHSAIAREKQLKHWKRTWKIELIERANPDWLDLYSSLF